MKNYSIEKFDKFFEAVLKLSDIDQARRFFEDVCTIRELEAIDQRLEVARLLKARKNYLEVSRQTGASTATISRVNKCLMYGGGGYDIVLKDSDESEGGKA